MSQEQFQIQVKIEQMMEYGYKAVLQFPKHAKHVEAAEIRLSMMRMLELAVNANVSREHRLKIQAMTELDKKLQVLLTQLRLVMRLEFLPIKKYEHWSKLLSEIGCMLGGWFKRAQKGKSVAT